MVQGSEIACSSPESRKIVDAILNTNFDEARQILAQWRSQSHEQYNLDFYEASILLAESNTRRGDQTKQLTRQALQLLESVRANLKTTKSRSSRQELVLGMSEAFIARIHTDQESWLKAYSVGRESRDRLRQHIRKNPDSEDAYLVLGLYEFYTGSVPKGLKWLTYLIDLSGNREQGLQWLQRAVAHAVTAAPEAARILIDELELQAPEVCQWLSLNEQLRDKYPANSRLSYLLQRNYRLCGHTHKALSENRKGYREFRGDRAAQSRLLAQRLLVYRDLGDIEMMKRFRKRFRPEYFKKRIDEARDVKNKDGKKGYEAPKPVLNDVALTLKQPCH